MHATRKVKLKDLSPNLTCLLCQGYFIDATSIIECLHSFCRSCIVQHLEKFDYCPKCEVQLHSTKPLSSIRSDSMLQEIVYKLVPGLFQSEMSQRRDYYKAHPDVKPRSQQDGGQVFTESYITSEDMIHLSLEFDTSDKKLRANTKRYFQCPAAVSIAILKKLVQGKYDLNRNTSIDIMYRERYLPDDFLLMDIAYKYSWSQNGSGPLQLYYRVRTIPSAISTFKRKSNKSPLSTTTITPEPIKRKNSIKEIKSTPSTAIVGRKPTLTPNGKRRGRPPRNTEENSITKCVEKIEEESKPKKIAKIDRDFASEVQLKISENGIISAKSVSSGEEKIINPVVNGSTNGIPPASPIGFMKKPITTNGNTKTPKKDEESKTFVKKIKDDKSSHYPILNNDKTKISPEKMTQTPTLLKVPTPKWIHSNGNNNGSIKTTPKASPIKDCLGFVTNGPSALKKPPKFFKSRLAETNNRTLEEKIKDEVDTEMTTPSKISLDKTPMKLTVEKISPPSNGNGHLVTKMTSKKNNEDLKDLPKMETSKKQLPGEQIGSTTSVHTEPIPTHVQAHNHIFSSHLVDTNMNMGTLPMQFVPNNFSPFPFFSNPNPYLASAWAMTLNLNNAYTAFANPQHSPVHNNLIQNHVNGNHVQKLTPAESIKKSSKKDYVQISPKKNFHVKSSKDKATNQILSISPLKSKVQVNDDLRSSPKVLPKDETLSPSKMKSPEKSERKSPSSKIEVKSPSPTKSQPENETSPMSIPEVELMNTNENKLSPINKVVDTVALAPEEKMDVDPPPESLKDDSKAVDLRCHNTAEESKMMEIVQKDDVQNAEEEKVDKVQLEPLLDKSEILRTTPSPILSDDPTVMATLTVSVDETKIKTPSSPSPGIVVQTTQKSPNNNNNIDTLNNDSIESSSSVVSVNLISSSTSTTTSA